MIYEEKEVNWTICFSKIIFSSLHHVFSIRMKKRTFWNFIILIKNIISIFIIGVVFIITAVLILIVTFKSWNQRGFDTLKARRLESFSKSSTFHFHLMFKKSAYFLFCYKNQSETHKKLLNVLMRLELKN